MSRETDLATLEPFLHLEQQPWGHVLRFSDDILAMAFASEAVQSFRALLEDLGHGPGQALVFRGTERSFSPERCNAYLERLGTMDTFKTASNFFPMHLSTVVMTREENVLGGLVRWLRSVKRPVIMVFEGDVSLLFLSIGLACDYRIASSETTFQNQSPDLDMPPGGGLLHLLPAYVGLGRANSIVTRSTQISAHSALSWGLLDEVAVPSELDSTCRALATQVAAFSPETLHAIRQLLNHRLGDFDSYFALETKAMERALQGRPWERITRRETKDAPLQG